MKFIFKSTVCLFCVFCSLTTNAQNKRLKYANKQYENMSYYYAYEAYEDVLERGIDSSVVAKNIADSYKNTNNIQKANDWYSFLYRNNELSQKEIIDYAQVKMKLGDYTRSEKVVKEYQKKYGIDEESEYLISSFENHEDLKIDEGRFVLKDTKGNSPASEIGVTYLDSSKILIASSQKSSLAINRIQSWTGGYYYNLYTSETDDQGNFKKLKPLVKEADSKFHDGPASFDSVNNIVYFTRNNYLKQTKERDSKGILRLRIYSGKLKGNGLKEVKELPFNSNEYSCAHPSISADGRTLYFSSDKPGGFGGADIYKVTINENGVMSEPINLGDKVNTAFDEIFPFQHPAENLLFFSSGGHQSLGGQDIFVAKKTTKGMIKSVENLGAPINTSMDDLSFTSNASQTKGYISSNRTGGVGADDIYGFDQLIPIRNSAIIVGNTMDLITSVDLNDVTISLMNNEGKIMDSVRSKEDGSFEIELNEITDDFKLVATKGGYIVTEEAVEFDDNLESYNQDLELMPIIDYYLAGKVQDKVTKELLKDVQITILDLQKNESLSDRTTDSTGRFNSENIDYKYADTVQYELVLSKDGYVSKTYVIRDLLSTSPEVYVAGQLNISLTPIEEGIDIGVELVLNPIYFDLNSSKIRVESKTELNKIVEFLQENPTVSMELGAHTDCRADDKYNLWLSKRRAKNSAKYIQDRISNPKRITFEGYGETKPVNNCNCESSENQCSDDEHQLNRRTEFIIVKMK